MKNKFIKPLSKGLISAALALILSSVPAVFADSIRFTSSDRLVQPSMIHTPELIGKTAAVDKTGYSAESDRGEGTIIAVIDSAFDVSHPIFALSDGVSGNLSLEMMSNLRANLIASEYYGALRYSAEDLYVSAKIPFAYDYANRDADVLSADFHGTHVAAVAAGNMANGGEFDGVAPDAQLILMKVAYDDGVFCEDYIVADAIDDAVTLGADVINLSFGLASGSSEYYLDFLTAAAVERAADKGVVIVCAAGNEGQASAGSRYSLNYGVNSPLVEHMDYGIVSEPSTLPDAISVAAAYNSVIYRKTFTLVTAGSSADEKIEYSDPDSILNDEDKLAFAKAFAGKTLNVVPVGGIGEESDYNALTEENISIKGKIALVARGGITFAEKIECAYKAGAAGIIIYNNIPDNEILMAAEGTKIPSASISYDDGHKLLGEYAESGSLQIEIPKNPDSVEADENEGSVTYFSSWGPTPELTLKPEITAIGNSVYSAVIGGGYKAYNGTSMASPMVASASALLRAKMMRDDYVLEPGSSFTDTAMPLLSAKIKMTLMNSAGVMTNDDGTAYSPRHQGSGLLDVSSALSLDTFIYSGKVEDMTYEAKVELGSDLFGIYTFPVTVYNASETAKEYALSGCVQSDGYNEVAIDTRKEYFIDLYNPKQFALSSLTVLEDESDTNLNRYSDGASAYALSLDAGERRTIYISVSISKAEFGEYNKIFKNGWFTEGFVYLSDVSTGVEISMPYMGFVGEWDNLPMFDLFSYDKANSVYPDQNLYTIIGETVVPVGMNLYKRGANLISDLIAFSPNRDGNADALYLGVLPLRNIYAHTIEIFTPDGVRAYGYLEEQPMITRYIVNVWDGSDGINSRYIFPDGDYTCVITGYTLAGVSQAVSLPVRIDRQRPVVESAVVTEKDGCKYLTISASDNHYIQTAVLYESNKAEDNSGGEDSVKDIYVDQHIVKYKKGVRTMKHTFDVTGVEKDYLYVEIVDYAFNTTVLRVDLP